MSHRPPEFMNELLDDIYHPTNPICRIIPTNAKEKEATFASFRPAPYTCLDYNISQTDTKFDAGDTKVHIRQTFAEYVPDLNPPPPPKPKKNKYFSGGPPQWEFLEDIWLRQQAEKQIQFHKEFKERVKLRKKLDKLHHNNEHGRIMKLIGPSWYQELSPKQISTVEKLKSCICKDLTENTIINTQENIGELGLVLRPNHQHITKALKNCCKCPVEFLLVLYQLINPTRTDYSINDRLLLSAVVHLTMKETLKELHIRIPSPPPSPKFAIKPPKKKKQVKYDSPYLKPFDFVKQPRKFSGIYKNSHVQYPTSPYFCYLIELRQMRETPKDNKRRKSLISNNSKQNEKISSEISDEIDKELQAAQSIYENLVTFRPVPTLLKPSIYILCDNFRNRKPPVKINEIDEIPFEKRFPKQTRTISCDCSPEDFLPIEIKKEDENCCGLRPDSKKCGCGAEEESPKKCTCNKTDQDYIERDPCTCVETDFDGKQTTTISMIGGLKETPSNQLIPIVTGVTVIPKKCNCAKKYEEALEAIKRKIEEEKQRKKLKKKACPRRDFKLPCSAKTIKKPKSRCIPPKPKRCCKKPKPCKCKKESLKLAKQPICTCEKCEEDRKQKTTVMIINGLKETESKQLVPIVGGLTVVAKKCECLHQYEDKLDEYKKERIREKEEAKKQRLQYGLEEPQKVAKDDKIKLPFPTEKDKDAKYRCPHEKEIDKFNQMYPLLRPEKRNIKGCKCERKYRELIDEPLCECEICTEERKKKNTITVIAGMKQTQRDETVTIIDRVIQEKPCSCLKKYEEKLENLKKEKLEEAKTPCGCRKVVKQLAETPFCQCEQCQEDRKRKAAKFIVAGTKEDEEGNLKIIEGISMGRKCDCSTNYDKRVEEYQKFKKRMQAIVDLKNLQEKFIISGVTQTPDGPIYQISGLRPRIDCACCKKARQDAIEKRMREIMPHIPAGRIKYNISGVRQTPTGNVYILNNALPIDDCDCMKLFKEFEEQHKTCNELYDNFVNSMKTQYEEFVSEMQPPENVEEEEEVIEEEEIVEEDKPICDCIRVEPIVEVPDVVECEEDESEESSDECLEECPCIVEEALEEVEKPPPQLKRFFIFDKISCEPKWQQKVLKKALKSMAEDGFPLAKLPQVHKLPHFKLWMLMRCRSYWTQENKYKSITTSRNYWRHCIHCKNWKLKFPKLNISKSKANLLDWSKADYCRKLVSDVFDAFYRRTKQNRINFGREFFPTTFTYEFPFVSWRDCYFAYTDSKEEEVHSKFVWQKHHFKNYADMKRCCNGV